MNKRFYTFAEIEAAKLCNNSGIAFTGGDDSIKAAADLVLRLAERIKNERENATMEFAANCAFEISR